MTPDYNRRKAYDLLHKTYDHREHFGPYICVYCRFPANTIDHVPSLKRMWLNHYGGKEATVRFLCWACKSCNCILGAVDTVERKLESVPSRRRHILRSLKGRRREQKSSALLHELNEIIDSIERINEDFVRIHIASRPKGKKGAPNTKIISSIREEYARAAMEVGRLYAEEYAKANPYSRIKQMIDEGVFRK